MISIIIVLRTHVLDTHACFQFPSSTRKACIHIHGTPCALFDQWGKDWSSFFFKKKTSQVAWEYWRFPFRGGAYGEAAHFWTESWYPNSGGSAKGSSLTNPHQETTVNWLNLSNSNWAPLQNFQSNIPPPFPALTIVDSLHDEGPAWLDIKIWACQIFFIKILASLE